MTEASKYEPSHIRISKKELVSNNVHFLHEDIKDDYHGFL